MTTIMKVLSLFDGISCGMVALERAGIQVNKYVAYEIEQNAIEVSKTNYPQIEHKGDVFKANYNEGEFDLLIGGSPCTYWSIAKGSDGRETTSSGFGWELFMQYVRALKEAKPKYFLYENNESMSDDIKEEITKQLGVKPIMIDSADFSAQTRKRYYWTNIPVDFNWIPSSLVFKDIEYEHDYRIISFEKYKNTLRVNQENNCWAWDTSGKGYYSQQSRARSKDFKMNTVPASGSDKNNIYLGDYTYRKIHPIEAERLQTLPDNYTSCIKSKTKRIGLCGNGWTVDVIAHILKGLTVQNY
jgi:DNA (cytosine-5)-methyltransferase 3A